MGVRDNSAERRQAVELEAAERFFAAKAAETEQAWAQVYAWVALHPEHGVAFARVEAGWDFARQLRDTPPDAPGGLATWMHDSIGTGAAGWLIAATLIVILCTVTLQLHGAVDRYHTALGENRAVRLADGSVIHLNTASSVEVALRDHVRQVHLLKGEARFDVAHDTRRPFLVTAGDATLRAVGTAFDVRLRSELTELTVIEGVVAVKDHGSAPRRVRANAQAAIRGGAVAITPLAPAGIRQRMAWQHGMVELDGDTLAQAVEELNRYRDTPLILGAPGLAALRVGGSFRVDRSADFVQALSASFGLRAIEGHDHSIILLPAQDRDWQIGAGHPF